MDNVDKKIFWDVNLENSEIQKNASFIIGRILEYGNENDIKWMLKNFKISQIKKILSTKKNISIKSARYWSSFFDVPKNKILCLKMSYQKMRKSHWPY
ncbi:MAG: hypothetical protein A2528_00065 [Candidatus Staskawiczbacteria bacterium RIFOXYD2_FULL_37_9]|uniref:DUF6922 domain-containing protein n=1 Tax=Candidatus Staskawiczbacteria bacterium RIFOXYB1_FULL_37_44 TaxID=1802223 RepID=A0A1G2IUA5_9BACT|nr:MAG: hypothetical protein A2358_02540 [Candidatus Staskawiczbacteria bacterium RIFOXYB1_FULL_37_44]OGZ84289.1 MAG: hypothetical protein A2416_01420 [Candidatus Staskawiczbacteria bacterium RIFOXYC1_FULL_37_52]OGZ89150.1 MAG: hypothetical protein A2581_01400 [Candidatus Staskawiczbacteria bacterium RIFOXYD1_FULL_37_110]OGZ89434.1 MAG: hypothetical protein A2444_04020 [Candidatus Staskawiczbacteria bacterium RIFOXYC2_FULL_37_19]OGZ94682.1 MAG: hypothetical protein A2528_00065 [Candidatus Stask